MDFFSKYINVCDYPAEMVMHFKDLYLRLKVGDIIQMCRSGGAWETSSFVLVFISCGRRLTPADLPFDRLTLLYDR